MKLLYKKLYEAFEAAKPAFIEAGLPPVATVDKYRGQPLEPEAFEYFELPAVFIGRQTAWTEENEGIWSGTVTLEFHLVLQTQGETGSQYTSYEEGLNYLKLVAQIRKVLDGFRTEFTSKLRRVSDNEVDTGVIVYEIIRYAFEFDDLDAAADDGYVGSKDETLEIRGGLVKHL